MLKKILIVVLALPFLIIGFAYLLPNETTVTRSIVINKSANSIFPAVNNFKYFQTWSPWAEKDPDTKVTFEGPVNSGGAKMMWESNHPEVGKGSQEIIESRANEYVEMKLQFNGQPDAKAWFELKPLSEEKTEVLWGFTGNHGTNPIMRYMGLMFDKWLGKDYEHGLAKLKLVVESDSFRSPTESDTQQKDNIIWLDQKGQQSNVELVGEVKAEKVKLTDAQRKQFESMNDEKIAEEQIKNNSDEQYKTYSLPESKQY